VFHGRDAHATRGFARTSDEKILRRQAVFRATPLFEQCVSAHSAERKRCRDPRTARLLSPHSRFRRSRRRDRRRSSRRLTLPVFRDGTSDHPSAQRKAARGDTRPPTFASSRLRVKQLCFSPQKNSVPSVRGSANPKSQNTSIYLSRLWRPFEIPLAFPFPSRYFRMRV
jgi:hypothetical protein